jgi:hypothetical protein
MPNAFSDEYGNAEETSLHIGMARWGFATLIAIAERLKINDPQIPQWKEYLAKSYKDLCLSMVYSLTPISHNTAAW